MLSNKTNANNVIRALVGNEES